MKLVFFDTETTGLDPETCQVIELAAKVYDENFTLLDEMDEFIRLVDPNAHIPEKIVELTGITDARLLKEGIPARQAFMRFAEMCQGEQVVLIAHNAQFDLNFVFLMMYRHYNEGLPIITKAFYLDTLTVAKDRSAAPHNLQAMIDHYHLSGKNTHRAIDDVNALVQLFCAMGRERNDYTDYLNVFGYNPEYGVTGHQIAAVTYYPQEYVDGMVEEENILPKRMQKVCVAG